MSIIDRDIKESSPFMVELPVLPPCPLIPPPVPPVSDDDEGQYIQVPVHRSDPVYPKISFPLPAKLATKRLLNKSDIAGPRPPPPLPVHPAPTSPTHDRPMKPSEPSSSPRPLPLVPSNMHILTQAESSQHAAIRSAPLPCNLYQQSRSPSSKSTTVSRPVHGLPSPPKPSCIRYQSVASESEATSSSSSLSSLNLPIQSTSSASSTTITTFTSTSTPSITPVTTPPASAFPNVRPLPRIPPAQIIIPTPSTSAVCTPIPCQPVSSRHLPRPPLIHRPKTSPSSITGSGHAIRSPFDAIPSSWASRLHSMSSRSASVSRSHSRTASASCLYRSRSLARSYHRSSADASRFSALPAQRALINRDTPSRSDTGSSTPCSTSVSWTPTSADGLVSRRQTAHLRSGTSGFSSKHSSLTLMDPSTSHVSPPQPTADSSSNGATISQQKISDEAAALLWRGRAHKSPLSKGFVDQKSPHSSAAFSPPHPRTHLPPLRGLTLPHVIQSQEPEISVMPPATISEVHQMNMAATEAFSDCLAFIDHADHRSIFSRSPSPMRYARPSSCGSSESTSGHSWSDIPSRVHGNPHDSHNGHDGDAEGDELRFSFTVPAEGGGNGGLKRRRRPRKRGRSEQLLAYRKSHRARATTKSTIERSPSPIRFMRRGMFDQDLSGDEDGEDIDEDSCLYEEEGFGAGKRHVQPRSYRYDNARTVVRRSSGTELGRSSFQSTATGRSSGTVTGWSRSADCDALEQGCPQGKTKDKFQRTRSGSPSPKKTKKDGLGHGAGVIDVTLANLSLGLVGRKGKEMSEDGNRPRHVSTPPSPSQHVGDEYEKPWIGWMLASRKNQSQPRIDFDPKRMSGATPTATSVNTGVGARASTARSYTFHGTSACGYAAAVAVASHGTSKGSGSFVPETKLGAEEVGSKMDVVKKKQHWPELHPLRKYDSGKVVPAYQSSRSQTRSQP